MDLTFWNVVQILVIVGIIAGTIAGIFLSGGACDMQSCITR